MIKVKKVVEALKKSPTQEYHGVLGIGDTERDLIGGVDVDVAYVQHLPDNQWKVPYVDQSLSCGTKDYTMACTMMSSYVALLSIFGGNEVEKEKRDILHEGIKRGYEMGTGWYTFLGVKTAVSVRNRTHPNKKVLYVRCQIGDDFYTQCIKKGYPVVSSRKLSSTYIHDKRYDEVVDGKKFTGKWGHAVSLFVSETYEGRHIDTYPTHPSNVYSVKYLKELVKCGFYSSTVFAIIPDISKDILTKLKEKKIKEYQVKKKIVESIMKLNSQLRDISSVQKTREKLHEMNEYFRRVGLGKLD